MSRSRLILIGSSILKSKVLDQKRRNNTHICGDGGAVETGVSVKAVPTPPLGGSDDLWESECRSLPSARLTTVFGGIRAPSFPDPEPSEVPLGLILLLGSPISGEMADVMTDRAMLECCAIPQWDVLCECLLRVLLLVSELFHSVSS